MKIAIIGYGRMGKTVERLATERGHEVILRATAGAPPRKQYLEQADVAIEFTEPKAAVGNILTCFDAGVPCVSGTTGWYNRLQEVRSACTHRNGSLIYASNFSLGVNLFNILTDHAAELLQKIQDYRPKIHEEHHSGKKDAPSGTALTLADLVLDHYRRLDGWSHEPEAGKLPVTSHRAGDIKGLHEVRFTSEHDQITLQHEAFSRDGFALGSIQAAEWISGRTGVFTMRDLLKNILE